MVYIFIYSVIHIKCDFSKLKLICNDDQLILVGSAHCLKELSEKNKTAFDAIHSISRNFQRTNDAELENIIAPYVKKFGAQQIRLLTNEDSAQLGCGRLREIYGIPGHGVHHLEPFVHKVISKNRLGSCVKLPKFVAFNKNSYAKDKDTYLNSLVGELGFPMFVKPVDLVSSLETHRVDDLSALRQLADWILTHAYEFEVDEYIEGDLFHCDVMIIRGEMQFFMVGKCSFPLAQFFEGKPVGSIPTDDPDEFNQLKHLCDIVCKKLQSHDGAYHLEFFLEKKSKEFVFLEIGARTGGALIAKMYEKLFSINIEEVNYLIQMQLLDQINVQPANIFVGFLNFPLTKGTVTAINKPAVDIAHEFIQYVNTGDELTQAKNLLDISCSIIFWDDNYQKIAQSFEILKQMHPLRICDKNG